MPSIFVHPQRRPNPQSQGVNPGEARPSPSMLQRLNRGRRLTQDIDMMAQRIILPSLAVADEDLTRLSIWESGRSLARQERWDELARMINSADDARLATPGGASEAHLLATGAQADVQAAVEDALGDGQAPDPAGIEALEGVLEDQQDCHAIAMVVAIAHLNIGQSWLSAPPTAFSELSPHRTHFKRAEALLAEFDAADLDSPSLAAVKCRLAETISVDCGHVIAAYHALLELDPHSAPNLRAFGQALVHALSDEPQLLDMQAREMAARTECIWGNGAYSWVYFDALKRSREALETVDTGLFVEGLRDILRHRPDQHITNELAAFSAISMAPNGDDLSREAIRNKAKLHMCQDWILSEHLHELHPLIWSDMSDALLRASAPRALVAQGRKAALRVIARRFADQLEDGSTIAFSPAGMYRLPAM